MILLGFEKWITVAEPKTPCGKAAVVKFVNWIAKPPTSIRSHHCLTHFTRTRFPSHVDVKQTNRYCCQELIFCCLYIFRTKVQRLISKLHVFTDCKCTQHHQQHGAWSNASVGDLSKWCRFQQAAWNSLQRTFLSRWKCQQYLKIKFIKKNLFFQAKNQNLIFEKDIVSGQLNQDIVNTSKFVMNKLCICTVGTTKLITIGNSVCRNNFSRQCLLFGDK